MGAFICVAVGMLDDQAIGVAFGLILSDRGTRIARRQERG